MVDRVVSLKEMLLPRVYNTRVMTAPLQMIQESGRCPIQQGIFQPSYPTSSGVPQDPELPEGLTQDQTTLP